MSNPTPRKPKDKKRYKRNRIHHFHPYTGPDVVLQTDPPTILTRDEINRRLPHGVKALFIDSIASGGPAAEN